MLNYCYIHTSIANTSFKPALYTTDKTLLDLPLINSGYGNSSSRSSARWVPLTSNAYFEMLERTSLPHLIQTEYDTLWLVTVLQVYYQPVGSIYTSRIGYTDALLSMFVNIALTLQNPTNIILPHWERLQGHVVPYKIRCHGKYTCTIGIFAKQIQLLVVMESALVLLQL